MIINRDALSGGYIYVIMPLGGDTNAAEKKKIIVECAGSAHLDTYFPMDNVIAGQSPDQALHRVMASLAGAAIVITDLSFERPSCYYELGLAEALGVPVRLIALDETDIHQSSNREQVRRYSDLASYERVISKILADMA